VNAVLAAHQKPPLARLAQLFRGDVPLLCTWPELDHYQRGALSTGQRYHGPSFVPTAGGAPVWPEGDGPKVFAYLKAGHPDHVAVLKALDQLGCRTLCYLPEVSAGKAPPVVSKHIHYASQPVDLGATYAQRCQLAICHAGEATLAQSLLAGVPLLLLPMQAEQFLMARCVAQTGAGVNAAELRRPTDFKALIQRLLHQPQAADCARAFAKNHANFSHAEQIRDLVDVFEGALI
jgi:hypothetical protein